MKCPADGTDLVMAERQGVEIDYCPKCRGVWLDRGELDKIIERASTFAAPQAPPPQAPTAQPWGQHQQHRGDHHKRRKSWLGDVFDF